MDKIGMSPLVATVLLIVFSLVLGMITLKYGGHFVEGQAVEYIDTGEVICPAGCVSEELAMQNSEFAENIRTDSRFGT